MAKNILVINCDFRETRVALIENGIIAELHIERETQKGTLGNIYLGKVSRVLPGMQAAFIDVGLERAAFLHVEDLIRPDDFEAYLAGHRRPGDDREERPGAPGTTAVPAPAPSVPLMAAAAPVPVDDDEDDEELIAAPVAARPASEASDTSDTSDTSEAERDVDIELPTALDVADLSDAPLTSDEDLGDEEREADEAEADEAEADEAEADDEASVDEADEADDEDEADEADDEADEADEAEAEADDEDDEDEADVEAAQAEGDEARAEVDGALPVEARAGSDAAIDEPSVDTNDASDASDAADAADASDAADEGEGEAAEGEVAIVAAVTESITAVVEGGAVVSLDEDESRMPRAGRRSRGRVRRSASTRDRQVATQGAAAATATPRVAEAPREGSKAPAREGREEPPAGRTAREPGRGRDARAGRDAREGGKRAPGRDGRRSSHEPPRVSKATPIREVVREGQEVIVQISKEPIGTKGARVTSHVSLPGRYVVYLPTVDHVGVSKRIGSEKERSRLRESIESMKPPQGGLIVRTVAEGLTKKQLKADIGYLVRLWGEIAKKRESDVRAPACLYTELDLVLKTARDLFTDDIEKIVIDSAEEYQRLQRFVEVFMPERVDAIELYEGEEPIFDAYGIEDEIQRAQSRKVPLTSGGYLIIDQAEALTAIDVNTGRFVGKGSKDLEETILATNLEAVEEIAYQLRFRNIGGLIILDLIDMERASNREKVRRRLEELLARDKAKTTLNRISDLGLIEMTRKRTRESLGRIVLEPCFYCDGTGHLQSKQTIAYEIMRQIRRERQNLPGYVIVVNAHPAVIDLLKSDERVAVQEAERLFRRRLELVPRKEYHLEQFDLQGR